MIKAKKELSHITRSAHHTSDKNRLDYLRLDMNENIDGLPKEFITEILQKVTPDFLSAYPDQKSAAETIAKYHNLSREQILLCNGSDGGIKLIFETFLNAGDHLLLTNPTFAMYQVYCSMFGLHETIVSYTQDFLFPFEEFMGKLDSPIKMAVIVNPNNPTGTIIIQNQLLQIIEKAYSKNILLVLDEAYFYYTKETAINVLKKYDNLIILRTFSKLCGLAGLRVGYLAASAPMIYDLKRAALTFDVNSIALLFAEELMKRPDLIESMIQQAKEGKEYLIQELEKKNISYHSDSGNFLLIPWEQNIFDLKMELEKRHILTGVSFGKYLRITIGSVEKMKQFLQNFFEITENMM